MWPAYSASPKKLICIGKIKWWNHYLGGIMFKPEINYQPALVWQQYICFAFLLALVFVFATEFAAVEFVLQYLCLRFFVFAPVQLGTGQEMEHSTGTVWQSWQPPSSARLSPQWQTAMLPDQSLISVNLNVGNLWNGSFSERGATNASLASMNDECKLLTLSSLMSVSLNRMTKTLMNLRSSLNTFTMSSTCLRNRGIISSKSWTMKIYRFSSRMSSAPKPGVSTMVNWKEYYD